MNAYTAAWSDFRLCCPKAPWLIGPADVKRWIGDMRTRALDRAVASGLITAGRRDTHIGLSEATQAQYLAAVSSFYSFCERYPLPGRPRVALFEGINPVKAKGVPRPQPKPFAEAAYLNIEQLRALLSAISTWALSSPARNLQGLRDYALFTAYLLTGGRSSEIRVLQWRDLRLQAGSPYYHWQNKGKAGWDELAVPAWEAIRTYLQLANRLSTIAGEDYIFTPLGDAAARFGRIEDWHTNRPLSGHEVGRLLKKYGALAGLDCRKVHIHSLRHSAYMLYTAAGSDIRFCSKLLHHSSLAITSRYDHIMAGQRNTEWAKAWNLLGLPALCFVLDTQSELTRSLFYTDYHGGTRVKLISPFLALIWGLLWALVLQYVPLGRFLAARRSWLAVVIGIAVDLVLLRPVLSLSSWLRVAGVLGRLVRRHDPARIVQRMARSPGDPGPHEREQSALTGAALRRSITNAISSSAPQQ